MAVVSKIGQWRCLRAAMRRANCGWTWHLVMSFLTTDPLGNFNAFGRRYWPISDYAKARRMRMRQ